MLLNNKLYLLTLTTIFIALGTGILIGASISNETVIIDEKFKIIVEQLENEFKTIKNINQKYKSEIENLNNRLDYKNKYLKELSLIVFNEKVKHKKYTILEICDSSVSEEIEEFLKELGVSIIDKVNLDIFLNSDINKGLIKDKINKITNHSVNEKEYYLLIYDCRDSISKEEIEIIYNVINLPNSKVIFTKNLKDKSLSLFLEEENVEIIDDINSLIGRIDLILLLL